MKHLVFLFLLAMSLVAIWYAFHGRLPQQLRFMASRQAPPAITAAYARRPQVDPVGTIHRIVDTGHRLGQRTAGALERMSGGR